MAVTSGPSADGMIGIAQAETLVAEGSAAWLWRDDCQLEALRPAAQVQKTPAPEWVNDPAARLERARQTAGMMEPLPPEHPDGSPLSSEELAAYRFAYEDDEP